MNSDQINLSALISLVITNFASMLEDVSDHLIVKAVKFFSLFFSLYNFFIWIKGKTFVLTFSPTDWKQSDDGYELLIPSNIHRKGKVANFSVYENREGVLAVSDTVGREIRPNGDIAIYSLRAFEGQCAVNKNDLKKI
jgi:hypothetical protein